MHKLYAETGTPLLPLLNLKKALARNLKIKGKSMKKEEKIVLDRFKTNPFLFFFEFRGSRFSFYVQPLEKEHSKRAKISKFARVSFCNEEYRSLDSWNEYSA